MTASAYLACDMGAESGRVILGQLSADRLLTVEVVHRFANGPLRLLGGMRWDLLGLFREILVGMRLGGLRARAGQDGDRPAPPRGVSVNSWGVDYALFQSDRQPLLTPPWCYRDGRTADLYAELRANPTECETLFTATGVQCQPFNTLLQLRSDLATTPELLTLADGFLPVADFLNFLLSGVPRAEESLASTTQLYDPRRRAWSADLIARYGLPARLFPEVVPSATVLGPLRADLARECGLDPESTAQPAVQVIAGCSHDTAAAVAATPASESPKGWAYLVSGTWSLLGVERPAPVLTPEARAANFTNEMGFDGSTRFLKNIAGLWLFEEVRREWALRGQTFTGPQLSGLAKAAKPFASLVHPNAARFLKPGGMLGRIADYCRESGQPAPATPGEVVRCIFESLALLYRQTLEEIEALTDQHIHVLHIVGAGSRSALLNLMTANATGRKVFAGPAEATAIGNILLQARALGEINSLPQLRFIVAASFPVRVVLPNHRQPWKAAAQRFASLTDLT